MAATLPYPSMDFTPLDVLTAAEMDQMVANDKYLADFCAGLADGTNIGNGMIQAFNFSSEETIAGKWVDGKTIYKKTISYGNLPNNSTKRVAHGISKLDRIIKVEQSVTNAPWDEKGAVVLSSTSAAPFNFYLSNTEVVVITKDDRSQATAYFTLYYTKTS